jgi:acetyltransferase
VQAGRGQGQDIAAFFEATSVALIGASERAGSLGTVLLDNLLGSGFGGPVYPVNPGYSELRGQPCHASVRDIDGAVDLAVIVTPAKTVPDILQDCGAAGVPAAVILSAGFRETGEAGRELEQQVLAIAHRHGIRRSPAGSLSSPSPAPCARRCSTGRRRATSASLA